MNEEKQNKINTETQNDTRGFLIGFLPTVFVPTTFLMYLIYTFINAIFRDFGHIAVAFFSLLLSILLFFALSSKAKNLRLSSQLLISFLFFIYFITLPFFLLLAPLLFIYALIWPMLLIGSFFLLKKRKMVAFGIWAGIGTNLIIGLIGALIWILSATL